MFLSRPFAHLILLSLVLIAATSAQVVADSPADPLLKLVPADASLTIIVEDLRGHLKTFNGSPLANGLRNLPSVRDWLASDRARSLQQSLKTLESVLGEKLPTIRDAVFGEAVVLTLRLPPGGQPDQARGLLLVRASDRTALDRLVDRLNAAQLKSGELIRVTDRERSATPYHVREFRPNPRDRAPEFYATINNRTLAWSNSEELIQGVIDRQNLGAGGLASLPDLQRIRQNLPERAVASLFVDPRFVERVLASAPRQKSGDDDVVFSLLGRYLGAVRYAGAALEWRDGLILHTEEVVNPDALAPSLKQWAGRTGTPGPASRRVPESALFMATAHMDFGALYDVLSPLIQERDRPKLDNVTTAINGLLLGLNGRSDIVPHLGPGLLFYVERPDGEPNARRLPSVLSIELGEGEAAARASSAIDNALRTFLAIYALDDKHGGGRLRIETRAAAAGSGTITSLSPSTPFAYTIHASRLILGTSPETVSRAVAAMSNPKASDRVERVRSVYFPDVVSFALADLRAIHTVADRQRPALTRRLAARQHRTESDAARDLDQVLALIDLFDAAFFTTTVAPDFNKVHHALGLVRLSGDRP